MLPDKGVLGERIFLSVDVARLAGIVSFAKVDRYPRVDPSGDRIDKAVGHHANDRVEAAAHPERPTDGGRVASQHSLPEIIRKRNQ